MELVDKPDSKFSLPAFRLVRLTPRAGPPSADKFEFNCRMAVTVYLAK